jgi:hypothetical protein
MRSRHLRAFAELETERDQIKDKLTALAKHTEEHGGDPALLNALPILGDVLPALPDKIKAQLFEAFDLNMLYSKTKNQVTCFATITASTPATIAAIIGGSETPDLAALLAGHPQISDLARHRRTTLKS